MSIALPFAAADAADYPRAMMRRYAFSILSICYAADVSCATLLPALRVFH